MEDSPHVKKRLIGRSLAARPACLPLNGTVLALAAVNIPGSMFGSF